MKQKWFLVVLCSVVGLGVLYYAIVQMASATDRKALNHELDLARSEGMPTTWSEFAATIPKANPSENAAPFYRELANHLKDSTNLVEMEGDLLLRPSPEHLKAAKAELVFQSKTLAAADHGAAMSKCFFDRDWTKGAAVLLPEYATMKFAAKLVALRGAVDAEEGRPTDAIKNIQEVIQISKHAGEEGTILSSLVEQAIFTLATRQLALWAFTRPTEHAYQKALVAVLNSWPKVDLQRMHRGDYLELQDVLKLSKTQKGRADLGIKEENVPITENLIPLVVSRPKADIKIAKSMRLIWESYGTPPASRLNKIDAQWEAIMPALAAYPTGGDIYLKLSSMDESNHTEYLTDQLMESHRICYLALARALAGNSIPKALETQDLKSPFDGKPLEYKFDGKQITIDVSCPDKDISLSPTKLPSDNDLTVTKKSKSR